MPNSVNKSCNSFVNLGADDVLFLEINAATLSNFTAISSISFFLLFIDSSAFST